MGSDPLRAESVTTRPEEVTITRWKRGSWPDPATHLLSIPLKGSRGRKYFFLPAFFKRINSSMKQIPLFLPGTVRSWAPKVLQYKGLGWNTAPWYTHAHTLLIFFLLRLVLLSLPVFGQRLDALSAALLSNETVREREGERTKAHEWETELEGGGRESARERSAQVKQSKQNGMRRECVVCTCVRVCLGVEVCRNGDADTNPHWKHSCCLGWRWTCMYYGRKSKLRDTRSEGYNDRIQLR